MPRSGGGPGPPRKGGRYRFVFLTAGVFLGSGGVLAGRFKRGRAGTRGAPDGLRRTSGVLVARPGGPEEDEREGAGGEMGGRGPGPEGDSKGRAQRLE